MTFRSSTTRDKTELRVGMKIVILQNKVWVKTSCENSVRRSCLGEGKLESRARRTRLGSLGPLCCALSPKAGLIISTVCKPDCSRSLQKSKVKIYSLAGGLTHQPGCGECVRKGVLQGRHFFLFLPYFPPSTRTKRKQKKKD